MTSEPDKTKLFGTGSVATTSSGDDRPAVYLEEIDGVNTYVFRASSLKTPDCQLLRLLQGETPEPWSDNTLAAFAAGHEWEPKIIERYEETHDGQFTDDQLEVVLQVSPNIIIRGHIDGIIVASDGTTTLGEVKCLAPTTMDSARRAGSIGGVFGYDVQLSIYMHALGMPGEWVVGVKGWVDNKGLPVPWPDRSQFPDGEQVITELYTEHIEEPPVKFGVIMRKLMGVVKAYENGDGGECPTPRDYQCRFWKTCDEKEDEVVTLTGPLAKKFDDAAEMLAEARALKAQAAAMEKQAKEDLNEIVQDNKTKTKRFSVTNPESSGRKTLDKIKLAEAVGDLAAFEKIGKPYRTMKVTEL